MSDLRLDDDGFLNMAALDDDAELSDADVERADVALRRAFHSQAVKLVCRQLVLHQGRT